MLKNFKIGLRLGLGFGIILVLLVIVGGYSLRVVHSLHDRVELLTTDRIMKLEESYRVKDNLNIIALGLRNMLLEDDKGKQNAELERVLASRKIIADILEKLKNAARLEAGKALIQKIMDARANYIKHYDAYMELIKAGQMDAAKKMLMIEVQEAQRQYMATVDDFIDRQIKSSEKEGHEAADEAGTATMVVGGTMAVALIRVSSWQS